MSAVGKYGEPWTPAESSTRTGAPVAICSDWDAWRAKKPNATPEQVYKWFLPKRDRAIACVNACAGLKIPKDAPLGWATTTINDLAGACSFALTEALAYCGEEENDDSPNGQIIRRLRAALSQAGVPCA